jgi:CrcB protein
MIKNILLAGFGGGIGSIARYLCQRWINGIYQHTFPLATFLVNVSGCLLIGIIYALAERSSFLSPPLRLFLTTGFCGGFTTFSTFAFENMGLIRGGDVAYFIWYSAGSLLAGIASVYAGYALIKFV